MSNNAIIVAAKRTGSTFLQNALNSHPKISCFDELFMTNKLKKRHGMKLYNFFPKWSYKEYIEWVFKKDESVCFRLMYPHFERRNMEKPLKKMKVPIIHLYRENSFKHAMSSMTKTSQAKRVVKPADIISKIKQKQRQFKNYRKKLKSLTNNYIEIKMEDMFGKTEGQPTNIKKRGAFNITSDQITYLNEDVNKLLCDFFDVEPYEMRCNVTKRNKEDMKTYIKNFDEVKKALEDNKMGAYLK